MGAAFRARWPRRRTACTSTAWFNWASSLPCPISGVSASEILLKFLAAVWHSAKGDFLRERGIWIHAVSVESASGFAIDSGRKALARRNCLFTATLTKTLARKKLR
jgi:hypothetical protein